jgi:hypothetical protein
MVFRANRNTIFDSRRARSADFLLQSKSHKTWLEVTDTFLNNEQAKFLNSQDIRTFSFCGAPDEPALRLINQLNRKLSKNSYRSIFEKYGTGFLLLTCEDFAFDEVNLARVTNASRPSFQWMIRNSLAKLISSIACSERSRRTNSFTRMGKIVTHTGH